MVADLLAVALLTIAPILGGIALALVIDAAVQLRALRRTGHVTGCPGLRGWTCDCAGAATPEPGA